MNIAELRERDTRKVQALGKTSAESTMRVLMGLFSMPIVGIADVKKWTGFTAQGGIQSHRPFDRAGNTQANGRGAGFVCKEVGLRRLFGLVCLTAVLLRWPRPLPTRARCLPGRGTALHFPRTLACGLRLFLVATACPPLLVQSSAWISSAHGHVRPFVAYGVEIPPINRCFTRPFPFPYTNFAHLWTLLYVRLNSF